MATTQAPQDGAAGPAAAARPDDLQSLKHHNQLLLANLNAGRKALAEARQNEQRTLQLYEQIQAQLAEREQAAAATLAVFQAQLAEAGVREQQLLALLQQERERAAASESTAGEPVDSGARDVQLLARIDALQQTLLDQLAQQAAPVAPGPEALEAARQQEQALTGQVAQLQQALGDKERALEATQQREQALAAQMEQREQALAAQVEQREQALVAQMEQREQELVAQMEQREQALAAQMEQREQALAAQVEQLQQALADKERALEAATVLQQMDEVVNKGRQIMAGLGPLQQHLENQGNTGEALQAVHGDLRQVMTQALAKMDTLLQAVAAQAEKLERLGKQAPPPAPAAATGNRSRFAADEHFVLDLPSDLMARTGGGAAPEAQDAPRP
jgi:hypothetical protein